VDPVSAALAHRDPSGLYLPAELAEERALERLRRELRAETAPFVFGPTIGFGVRGLGSQPSHEALLQEAGKGWPAIAANRIADRVQSLVPNVFVTRRVREGTVADEQLDDHPAVSVLARPNPIFSWSLMSRLVVMHLLAVGEGYWQKVRDGLGVTRELWPMPPQFVRPKLDPLEVISGYEIHDGQGRVRMLPRSEVIRFWWPDPETLYTSRGVLGPQAVEHDTLRFLSQHLREFFARDAVPRVVITAGAGVEGFTRPEKDTFYAEWIERYNARTGSQRGLPAFIPTGFDVKELGQADATSGLVPLDERRGKQLLAAYGVPGSIAGLVEDVSSKT
jgi:hypothetical protein